MPSALGTRRQEFAGRATIDKLKLTFLAVALAPPKGACKTTLCRVAGILLSELIFEHGSIVIVSEVTANGIQPIPQNI